jgi:hypothetical protein
MKKRNFSLRLSRYGAIVSALFALHQVGCLPEGGFQQVTAENVIFTAAVTIQSVTAVIFNTLFGVF